MEKLYYLLDKDGKYRNFIIFCQQPCELPASSKDNAIIYTENQLAIAKRYFKSKQLTVTSQEILHEKQSISTRRLRKRAG